MTTKITDKNISNLANIGVQWQSVITADGSTTTTAVAGQGYFIDTTSAAHTINLPTSATAGDTVAIKDYAGTFATNALTIGRNGHNIQGVANDSQISTNRANVELVYIDSTKGWLYSNESNVSDLQSDVFISATGGTVITSGNFKIHIFTGDGCFVVSQSAAGPAPNDLDYVVVAGGGGGGSSLCAGGNSGAGGAGAGGYRESKSGNTGCYTASPLATTTSIPASVQTYPITVGGGGTGAYGKPTGSTTASTNGSNSVFSTITSAGGGRGATAEYGVNNGGPGGSGGGGATPLNVGGTGNTPPVSPPQGNNGGAAGPDKQFSNGGGGGGAGEVGDNGATLPSGTPGPGWPRGGDGTPTGSVPSSYGTTGPAPGRYFAGGGSGGTERDVGPGGNGQIPGGAGGGGHGSNRLGAGGGTANTGGGGGGGGGDTPAEGGGNGGKGIVMIRY